MVAFIMFLMLQLIKFVIDKVTRNMVAAGGDI